jgi:rubredoxin
MFFIMGIASKTDKLDFNQNVICPNCGRYGRYEAFMEYTSLSLFFIPVFKWGKKYYVKTSCCGSTYSINRELGRKIERNEDVTLEEQDLHIIRPGYDHRIKRCLNCGFETIEDYRYCPKCSAILE